ncbi:MAG: putative toxin-antitoxin system toxin component, PIN family [Terriglobia bacterium]|jgi:putative PIN family toxin of toxin-antitoxin system
MRLILDTNVLLSAQLLPRGAPAKLLAAWEQKRFTLVISDELLAELREVLERPFFRARLRRSDAELFAATLHDLALCYPKPPPSGAARDAKDSFLLALAASKAAFLVTGDKGLLALKRHGATRIVTPAAMLEWLKAPDAPVTETP